MAVSRFPVGRKSRNNRSHRDLRSRHVGHHGPYPRNRRGHQIIGHHAAVIDFVAEPIGIEG
jgi:hypothetical protein